MFGLMTVARHGEIVAEFVKDAREACSREAAVLGSVHARERVRLEREADHWRALATKLAADLVDLRKREAPLIPGPEEAATGSVDVGDAEWTPSAFAARAQAAK